MCFASFNWQLLLRACMCTYTFHVAFVAPIVNTSDREIVVVFSFFSVSTRFDTIIENDAFELIELTRLITARVSCFRASHSLVPSSRKSIFARRNLSKYLWPDVKHLRARVKIVIRWSGKVKGLNLNFYDIYMCRYAYERQRERERKAFMRANKRVFVSRGSQAIFYSVSPFDEPRPICHCRFRFLHIWPSLVEDTEVYFESNSYTEFDHRSPSSAASVRLILALRKYNKINVRTKFVGKVN